VVTAGSAPEVRREDSTGKHQLATAILEIDWQMLDAIVQHLRSAFPHEGCGLLATVDVGDARRAVRFFPGDNLDRSATRFTMDPRQVIAAMNEIAQAGWQMGAIVHSHPKSAPIPSPTDLREAYYPDAWLVIVSLVQTEPEARAWDVSTGTVPREKLVRIVPG
jgi:proteasome lid subunit RPN8/RPN11